MLELQNISKDMGEFLLDSVSMKVEKGDYLVILGPTGAGKTILLETVAGVYPPDNGRIFLNNRDITDEEPRKRNICMVYQDYMLFPHLNVEDNIGFGLRIQKVDKDKIRARVKEVAELFGISHLLHRYPDTLSGGEKQRTAISRAIIMDPEVLLLDEPLSALDGQTRERLRSELKNLHRMFGTTIIHITHNFSEVFALADKVAVMNKGEIVQYGFPDDIFRKPNCEFTANFMGVENIFRGRCIKVADYTHINIEGLTLISSSQTDEAEAFASIRPEDIIVSREPVETSARNSLKGKVIDIIDSGTLVKLCVDTGIVFMVVLTRQGWREMDLKEGDELYLMFKASSVHIF